jgi:5-dehydro-2-deoxygluconokinase
METATCPGNTSDEASAARFLRKSARVVLIKHGHKGSRAFTRNGSTESQGIYPVKVVNTMGAGDSYASAFLYCLIKGYSVAEAMRYAAGSASIVVSKNDCSEALPDIDELETFIATHKMVKQGD